MSVLDKLEKKFRRFGISNLMLYITVLNGIVFLLSYVDRENLFLSKLILVPSLVMQGEVWRLITFLFIPPSSSIIWLFFILYFYYMIGNTLEHEWGSFKFTVYYLIGVLGAIGAAFLGGAGSALFLNLSLLFAFSYLFPNYQIMLFFFIPLKMKYLSWFYAAYLVYIIYSAPYFGLITVLGSVVNFLLFFGKDIIIRLATGRKVYNNRRSFEAKIPRDVIIHRCTVCGKTEKDDKNLEFRYCVDCKGDYEYCMEHLHTHIHKQ